MKKIIFLIFILTFPHIPALASENVSGTFEAVRACDAYSSFRKGHNPGLIKVKPGETYEAAEVNKPGEWEWIRVMVNDPSANPPLRWVARECGKAEITFQEGKKPENGKKCSIANQYDSFVLALTWEPGFCEHYHYSGVKPECDALNNGTISLSHLTIHGLWPNKDDCGTRYGHCADTPLDLSEDTVIKLAPWMPNFYYSTAFGEYEWKKHGTCQGLDDDDYFLLAEKLLQRVDESEIGSYLRENIGKTIHAAEFKSAIAAAMGNDVAERMQLICTQNTYLEEIRINLPKQIDLQEEIQQVIGKAKKFNAFTNGCSDAIYIEASGKN